MSNEKYKFHVAAKIFVNENLTPMDLAIAYTDKKLKHSGLIHICYSRNGIVHIKENGQLG